MSEVVFVEEYRKELENTGYPFNRLQPIITDTGYHVPFGLIQDASVYVENLLQIPRFLSIEKQGAQITLRVGEYAARFSLKSPSEVVEFYSEDELFGGIFVLNTKKAEILQGWRDGLHTVISNLSFCPRCLELVPPNGVQRLKADSGELFSGTVVLIAGTGGMFQAKNFRQAFNYIQVDYIGDPTYIMRNGDDAYTTPVQEIVCVYRTPDQQLDLKSALTLTPGELQGISLIACDTKHANFSDDALRIGGTGSQIIFSLAGM